MSETPSGILCCQPAKQQLIVGQRIRSWLLPAKNQLSHGLHGLLSELSYYPLCDSWFFPAMTVSMAFESSGPMHQSLQRSWHDNNSVFAPDWPTNSNCFWRDHARMHCWIREHLAAISHETLAVLPRSSMMLTVATEIVDTEFFGGPGHEPRVNGAVGDLAPFLGR